MVEKTKRHRVAGSQNKVTMAELERQLAELRAGRAADSKKLDEVLRQLGELSARALLGKDSDDAEG